LTDVLTKLLYYFEKSEVDIMFYKTLSDEPHRMQITFHPENSQLLFNNFSKYLCDAHIAAY